MLPLAGASINRRKPPPSHRFFRQNAILDLASDAQRATHTSALFKKLYKLLANPRAALLSIPIYRGSKKTKRERKDRVCGARIPAEEKKFSKKPWTDGHKVWPTLKIHRRPSPPPPSLAARLR
jgi:hypothetical protein